MLAAKQVADSLARIMSRTCPKELKARLAHWCMSSDSDDDRRTLNPGEWLVTRDRRISGAGMASSRAAKAERRRRGLKRKTAMAELDEAAARKLRECCFECAAEVERCTRKTNSRQRSKRDLDRSRTARCRFEASDEERQALRALDQAEAARERHCHAVSRNLPASEKEVD